MSAVQQEPLTSLTLVPFSDVLVNVTHDAHTGLQDLAERLPGLSDEERYVGSGPPMARLWGWQARETAQQSRGTHRSLARPWCMRLRHRRRCRPPTRRLLLHPSAPAASARCCSTCRRRASACSACTCARSGRTSPRRSTLAARCSRLPPTMAPPLCTRVRAAALLGAAVRHTRSAGSGTCFSLLHTLPPSHTASPTPHLLHPPADEFFRLHEELRFGRAPLFDVPTALHILHTGAPAAGCPGASPLLRCAACRC